MKERIRPLAERSGKTPHAWMIEALERQAALAELREGFLRDGEEAAQALDAGAPLYAGEDVHRWLQAKAAGKRVPRPRPARIGRNR